MIINLRQAIKLVAKLRTELNEELRKIDDSLNVPLSVNGKSAVTEEKEQEANVVYENINDLHEDIVKLRIAISQANSAHGLDDTNIDLQETRKLVKNLKQQLQSATAYGGSSKVVSGVGVVEEGIVRKHHFEGMITYLESDAEACQDRLDEANNDIEIEVELKTV